eukprot:m51a1_g1354 hypothetical protein (671) ;mRNA; f:360544-368659
MATIHPMAGCSRLSFVANARDAIRHTTRNLIAPFPRPVKEVSPVEYNPSGLSLLFQLRGTVAEECWLRALLVGLVGVLIVLLERFLGEKVHFLSISGTFHTFVGMSLSLLLVFRTNTCYERWREGRLLLGTMVNKRLCVAYVFSVRNNLRNWDPLLSLDEWLTEDDIKFIQSHNEKSMPHQWALGLAEQGLQHSRPARDTTARNLYMAWKHKVLVDAPVEVDVVSHVLGRLDDPDLRVTTSPTNPDSTSDLSVGHRCSTWYPTTLRFPASLATSALEGLGNMSYSVYLVHWPVIHLLRLCLPSIGPLALATGTLSLTAGLAYLSYRLIEQRVQSARWPRHLTVAIFIAATVMPALMAQVGYQDATFDLERQQLNAALEAEKLAHKNDMAAIRPCEGPSGPSRPKLVDPAMMPWRLDGNNFTAQELLKNAQRVSSAHITGNPNYNHPWHLVRRSPAVLVMLVGDSHACQYSAAVREMAEGLNASFVEATLSNPGAWQFIDFTTKIAIPSWVEDFPFRFIISAGFYYPKEIDPKMIEPSLRYWSSKSTCMAHLADGPKFEDRSCLLNNIANVDKCTLTESAAGVGMDVAIFNATAARDASFANKTEIIVNKDFVCWDGLCPMHIGNIPVLADRDHYSDMAAVVLHRSWVMRFQETRCHATAAHKLREAAKEA